MEIKERKTMKNLLNISLAVVALAAWSCAPSQYASRAEFDDIYFASSDIKEVSFQSLVSNNEAQTFNRLQQAPEINEMESFSARNVNPDFLGRYTNDGSLANLSSDDYFVEGFNANPQNNGLGGNTTYNNFYMNQNRGFAGNPMFYDPFWDPFWGPGFSTFGMMNTFGPMGAWGFGPRWTTGINVGFGFGGGFGMNNWNRMGMGMGFGWNRLTPAWFFGGPGMGMDPFFWDPWYNPAIAGFYSPWNMGRFGGWGPGFGMGWGPGLGMGWGGFGGPFINNGVLIVNRGEQPIRNVVRGPRDGRASQVASGRGGQNVNNMIPTTANSRSALAAQRSATTGRESAATMGGRGTNTRAFSSSQNDLYSASRRGAMSNNMGVANAGRGSTNLGTSSAQARRSYVTPNANTMNTRRQTSTSTFGRPTTTMQRNNTSTMNRTTTSPTRSNSTMMRSNTTTRSTGSTMSTMSSGGSRMGSSGGGSMSSGGRGGR
jgi:hypothetical protein